MNYEHVVTCSVIFNITWERTWLAFRNNVAIRIFNLIRSLRRVNILSSYDRPSADFTNSVFSPIDVDSFFVLLKSPFRPCSLSVTIGELFEPFNRT